MFIFFYKNKQRIIIFNLAYAVGYLEVTVTLLPFTACDISSPSLDGAPVYRRLNPRLKPVAKTTCWTETRRIKCLSLEYNTPRPVTNKREMKRFEQATSGLLT